MPKGKQIEKAKKAKCKTCIKRKKPGSGEGRRGTSPVCLGNVYFGPNSLIWWLIRVNQICILGFLGVEDAMV